MQGFKLASFSSTYDRKKARTDEKLYGPSVYQKEEKRENGYPRK